MADEPSAFGVLGLLASVGASLGYVFRLLGRSLFATAVAGAVPKYNAQAEIVFLKSGVRGAVSNVHVLTRGSSSLCDESLIMTGPVPVNTEFEVVLAEGPGVSSVHLPHDPEVGVEWSGDGVSWNFVPVDGLQLASDGVLVFRLRSDKLAGYYMRHRYSRAQ